nr:hypothetical protein [Blastocatellia bacterium]
MFRRSPKLSDDEFVERLRRGIGSFDRFRPWIILFWLGLAIGIAPALLWAWNGAMKIAALGNLGQPANAGVIGFGLIAGVGMGIAIGNFADRVVGQLLQAVWGYRTERLLVRYYDLAHGQERFEDGRAGEFE